MAVLQATPRISDAGAARATMRSQIAMLERRLGALAYELGMSGRSQPLPPAPRPVPSSGARLLGLGELESIRDSLVERVRDAELVLGERLEREARSRETLESMLGDPRAHRFAVIERMALGEPGCGAYQSRPRLGLLGMLFDWWCVKLSSGCP